MGNTIQAKQRRWQENFKGTMMQVIQSEEDSERTRLNLAAMTEERDALQTKLNSIENKMEELMKNSSEIQSKLVTLTEERDALIKTNATQREYKRRFEDVLIQSQKSSNEIK